MIKTRIEDIPSDTNRRFDSSTPWYPTLRYEFELHDLSARNIAGETTLTVPDRRLAGVRSARYWGIAHQDAGSTSGP
jgi:hypothetical protein